MEPGLVPHLAQGAPMGAAMPNPNNMNAIIGVLDDFAIADLHEVLVRDGLYLPDICHW